eukprot:1195690-Prorocentrum_minimum.AAC.7
MRRAYVSHSSVMFRFWSGCYVSHPEWRRCAHTCRSPMMGEYGQVKTPRGLSTDYRLRARLYIGRSEEDALGPGYST